jgi:hypothetical protein
VLLLVWGAYVTGGGGKPKQGMIDDGVGRKGAGATMPVLTGLK